MPKQSKKKHRSIEDAIASVVNDKWAREATLVYVPGELRETLMLKLVCMGGHVLCLHDTDAFFGAYDLVYEVRVSDVLCATNIRRDAGLCLVERDAFGADTPFHSILDRMLCMGKTCIVICRGDPPPFKKYPNMTTRLVRVFKKCSLILAERIDSNKRVLF
jgi:hypothetical protein